MRLKITIVLIAIMMMAACSGARISAPAEEMKFTKQVAEATLVEFIKHYMALVAESRGPTIEEVGYWTAKLQSAELWYQFLSTKVREESFNDIWGIIIPVLQEAATWK